ncbi:hypothetical protein [Paenibacillus larvae]|uniref:Uncharacterized protein n=1 Tax=Paenibacillus larvae subsp. larvae TaxID=147375 RepID=A0A2L1U3V4_9BACL|nr:hypothetical protein [Paenibacillus larvae]AQZ45584.1 hypothetical protein B5S25_02200 [Paenibacillus larvae subsp. pulvifaciens]AVF27584.1 hypothetical protein ERICIII_03474 [Paenibacillus larvae subsp. larvae]MBH0344025.1 hypothetical protein [Paenibacillus larvae]MCY7520882.1 hypothetical protein [Paenibacillus larvae]MCY9503309.1 hypothetical protein [Paenibacillus larvae]
MNKTVFDRKLAGKAIYLHGTDSQGYEWDTYALVKSVKNDLIEVVLDSTETESLTMADIEAGLSMEVWERGAGDE